MNLLSIHLLHMNTSTSSQNENTAFHTFLSRAVTGQDIAAAVAQEALDYDNPARFFEDLAQNGCISGMVWSLIYYHDTHAFFDKHYHEIEEIRLQIADDIGIILETSGDLKNHLAWLAFEYRASQLYSAWHDE